MGKKTEASAAWQQIRELASHHDLAEGTTAIAEPDCIRLAGVTLYENK
jgi:hypothetical protein